MPPCNIGPLSTPNYAATYLPSSGTSAIQKFSAGGHTGTVFAGQRAEGFYVDLGAVFDLGDLRGFAGDHLGGGGAGLMNGMPGVNSTADVNVHSLALQVPITQLVAGGKLPTSTTASNAVIGVWTSASRRKVRVNEGKRGENTETGPYVQVSRLGNPLVNELLIGIGDKDYWNYLSPRSDGTDVLQVLREPVARPTCCRRSTRGCSRNLAAYNTAHSGTTKATAARPDLVAILLSGIPNSVTGRARCTADQRGWRQARRPSSAQRRSAADGAGERKQPRLPRRRPGRFPERPPGLR